MKSTAECLFLISFLPIHFYDLIKSTLSPKINPAYFDEYQDSSTTILLTFEIIIIKFGEIGLKDKNIRFVRKI